MAEFRSVSKLTKNNVPILIRSANIQDAEQILFVSKSVLDEEVFQLTASHEFKMSLDQEKKWIQSFLDSTGKLLLVAEIENQIVGQLDFSSGHRQRISHTGDFGVSILKKYRNIGIGSLLLQTLIEWAKSTNQIEKINLQVHSTNIHAISAYKKNGFIVEGTRKNEIKYGDNNYVDSVLMSLNFNSPIRQKIEFPILTTDRLILRPLQLSDSKDIQRMAGSSKIAATTATIPHPYLDGVAEEWILKHQEWFEKGLSVDFGMQLKSTDQLIGNISLMINKSNQRAEIGYWVGEDHWNNGYCTEAMKAVIGYAFEIKKLNKITCRHIEINPQSGKVMEKSGLTKEGYLRQELFKGDQFYDTVVYGLLKSEWIKHV